MSLSQSVLQSSFLLFLTKFISRGIGLVSTLILARLLTPEDYGIVAIATVLIYLFDEMSNTGMKEYIIHKSKIDDDILNTAWTLNLITKLIVWFGFLLLIPLIVDFYDKPDLMYVLFVTSLILPIGALSNVGIVMFEKELNYKPIFYLELSQKVIAFIFIIAIALWYESYWAMIIGNVISYIVMVFGSYFIHTYRPKFSLKYLKQQWEFSKWMLPKGFLGFSKAEFDTFIVAKIFDFNSLGGFNVMKTLTAMVGRDVIIPATQPLLASFSKVKDDPKNISSQLILSLLVILVISTPIMAFIWLYHEEIVLVLLGDQWTEFSNVLKALSLLISVYAIAAVLQHLLTSLGRVKSQFYFELFGFIATVVILLSINFDNLVEFSFVRSFLAIALVAVLFVYVRVIIGFSVVYFLFLALPVFCSIFMSSLFVLYIDLGKSLPTLMYVGINGIIFLTAYCVSIVSTLYFYRHKSEIVYLRWVAGQTIESILNKVRKSKKT